MNGTVRELFEKAAALIRASRYSAAIPLLRQAVALAPDESSLHHYWGYALWKLNQWSDAAGEFEKARRLDPTNAYTCYFLGRIAQSSGDLDRSISFYEIVLKLGPPVYDTNQRLGQAYFDKGELGKARSRVEAALKETPWDGSLYYQMGKIDQKMQLSEQARAEFEAADRLKRVDQTSGQRLLDLSEAVRNRQTDAAHALRDEFLNRLSQDPEILDSVGVLLGRAGLYDDAIEPLERAVKLAPNSYESNCNLGLTLLKLDREAEAESRLQRALSLEPNSLEANSALAVLYVNQNRNREAIERLRAADEASPGNTKILALLGAQYLAGHYIEDAVRCLRETIRLRPDDPQLRYLLVEAYEDKHDYDSALSAAQEAAQRFPEASRADYEVGQQLANLARYQEARSYAERALQKDSSLVEAYNLLADIESRSGEYEPALDHYRKATALEPKNVTAFAGVAQSLIRLKRFPEAVAELQQAISVQPQSASLYFSLMQAYARLGQREEADEAAATYQKLHALETAQRDAEAPRSFSPPDGNNRP